MPLYEVGATQITPLPAITFAAAGVKERADLQRLLREQVEIISPDTLVVAEEFGDWEDSRRRIDLLGIDRDANLVVIELKRTEDGGHMELQALRYAAMISTMTFQQVVETFSEYLRRLGKADDPRSTILNHLGWDEPDEARFAQEVRIVLASADFSRELTTAVMWLNERDLDIRCVRLSPYQHGDHVVLDVQQVIPLPEADDYRVKLREKLQRERDARVATSGKDLTRFTVTTAQGVYNQLPKRRAILQVIRGLIAACVSASEIQKVLQAHHPYRLAVLRGVPGNLDAEGFLTAVAADGQASGRAFKPDRYFCGDDLIRSNGYTYALTNQWGAGTVAAVESLLAAFPNHGVSCEPEQAAE